MTDSSKIIRFCEESEVGPFTKKLISLVNLVMRRNDKMANKRIFYNTVGIKCGPYRSYDLKEPMNKFKIGDKVKVVENDEGFNKDALNTDDFQIYKQSIGHEYEVTGILNLKNKTRIAVDYSISFYPACVFEKIDNEQKEKTCTCELSLIMAQGCQCGGK